ncbi:hypothetical protein [Brevibacillus sp. SYSU BS000544]|uniref:hypothetical protein n=1 Tax=Brevibacillus sp. SYSU BS000544 TaxID=3416443 RepID=UPI003CE51C77
MKLDTQTKQNLLACTSFGLSALFLCLWLLPWPGWKELIFAAGIGAFLSTSLLWKKMILRHPNPSPWRGAGVGVCITLISYPIAWYLVLLYAFFTGATDSLGGQAANPLESIVGTLIMSFASLVFFGWPTLLVGAIVGCIVTIHSRARQ